MLQFYHYFAYQAYKISFSMLARQLQQHGSVPTGFLTERRHEIIRGMYNLTINQERAIFKRLPPREGSFIQVMGRGFDTQVLLGTVLKISFSRP